MRGIFKGFKFIAQIFVYKEPEMEIGYPTDVKHVAHIGYSNSANVPSWMTEFKTASDFSFGIYAGSGEIPWVSQESNQPKALQSSPGMFSDSSWSGTGSLRKKKRKKSKSASFS
ncbi:hypothetical protein HPP92_009186 [Vanilla planifolia]|uniref:CRIB domain-containing protein n=2 Tax=Vanilla planifolia TaxID=51239 RepID=A0A835V8L7_VANPL|nr:hypothetical protein HPP92_009389 [Vanilla planifolia]KAG0487091.1 hypothetical protein HPP92_009186 [Vanilla planifolia]